MGYFSNLAAQYVPDDHDHSYAPPENRLLLRLEDPAKRYGIHVRSKPVEEVPEPDKITGRYPSRIFFPYKHTIGNLWQHKSRSNEDV